METSIGTTLNGSASLGSCQDNATLGRQRGVEVHPHVFIPNEETLRQGAEISGLEVAVDTKDLGALPRLPCVAHVLLRPFGKCGSVVHPNRTIDVRYAAHCS